MYQYSIKQLAPEVVKKEIRLWKPTCSYVQFSDIPDSAEYLDEMYLEWSEQVSESLSLLVADSGDL